MIWSTSEFYFSALLGILFFVFPTIVHSQPVHAEENLLRQSTYSESTQLLSSPQLLNRVYIHQVGDHQQAFVQQQGLSQDVVLQTGSFNYMFLIQSVEAGIISITQMGIANRYEGAIRGAEIEATLLQQGEYNTVWQQVSSDQFSSEIIQQGYGNEIQQMAEGAGSIKVIQRGNDMKVIIKSNN